MRSFPKTIISQKRTHTLYETHHPSSSELILPSLLLILGFSFSVSKRERASERGGEDDSARERGAASAGGQAYSDLEDEERRRFRRPPSVASLALSVLSDSVSISLGNVGWRWRLCLPLQRDSAVLSDESFERERAGAKVSLSLGAIWSLPLCSASNVFLPLASHLQTG